MPTTPSGKQPPCASSRTTAGTPQFTAARLGQYEYTLIAWVDHFKTLQRDIEKKFEAEQDITVDLQSGALLLRAAAERAKGADAASLRKCGDMLLGAGEPADKVAMVLSERTTNLVQRPSGPESGCRVP